jgi:hypothetical protein
MSSNWLISLMRVIKVQFHTLVALMS